MDVKLDDGFTCKACPIFEEKDEGLVKEPTIFVNKTPKC